MTSIQAGTLPYFTNKSLNFLSTWFLSWQNQSKVRKMHTVRKIYHECRPVVSGDRMHAVSWYVTLQVCAVYGTCEHNCREEAGAGKFLREQVMPAVAATLRRSIRVRADVLRMIFCFQFLYSLFFSHIICFCRCQLAPLAYYISAVTLPGSDVSKGCEVALATLVYQDFKMPSSGYISTAMHALESCTLF